MEREYYDLSNLTEFFTNSEEERSSNIDSNEEREIISIPPIERPEAGTDCDSNGSDNENEKLLYHMPHVC